MNVATHVTSLDDVLRSGALHSEYQPIVDLTTGRVLALEALARGPEGSDLARPDQLFAAAAHQGRVVELDWACRAAAVRGALATGMGRAISLFVNVEPVALHRPVPTELVELFRTARRRLHLVAEVTERALVDDPAGMIAALTELRTHGIGIALDDVGAEPTSLALLPFVEPDVIKLDLRLVQERTDAEVALIAAAVRADAEQRGALVLAEGIETEAHRRRAEVLGATLGQGWLFGRPRLLGDEVARAHGDPLLPTRSVPAPVPVTPWALVAGSPARRTATKALLMPMSRHIEAQALAVPGHGVVLGSFQDARHVTDGTRRRYAALATRCVLVGALARGLDDVPVGVRKGRLRPDDPMAREWTVAVVGPHYAGALIARERDEATAGDRERRFDYVITHDRPTVVTAARSLLTRLDPR